MSSQELLFTPDRRGTQDNYVWGANEVLSPDIGSLVSDPVIRSMDKICQTRFPWISADKRRLLVRELTNNVPLDHRNMPMIIAAGWIYDQIKFKYGKYQLSKEDFAQFYDKVEPQLAPDIHTFSEDVKIKLQTTLLRYLKYVSSYLEDETQAVYRSKK